MGDGDGQGGFQVRFDWGVAGVARLAVDDLVVVVDVLDGAGDGTAASAVRDAASAAGAALVLDAGIPDAADAAELVLREQEARGRRTGIAVVAVGEPPAGRERDADAPLRFAVEDLLGAGAVIDALGALGIDHTSPEAAAAAEAFRSLSGGMRHLVAASETGRALRAAGRGDEVRAATARA